MTLATPQSVEFNIKRESTEELTFATVTAMVDKATLLEETGFLVALRRAITSWVRETKDGAEEWSLSSQDFNIGDLACCYENEELVARLKIEGITELDVETHSESEFCSDWMYDTILADEE